MKRANLFIFIIILSLFSCKNNNHILAHSISVFKGDSGIVLKKDLHRLLRINPKDTMFHKLYNSDTLGKYYKLSNGNYMVSVAIYDGYEYRADVLCKVKPDGSIQKREAYMNGNYVCCWKNPLDGFYVKSDYTILKSCGTGSAYCGGDYYIFKDLLPQDSLEPVLGATWTWTGVPYTYLNISSKYEFRNDKLVIHYHENRYFDNDTIKKDITNRNVDIAFSFIENKWVTKDTINLNRLSAEH